MLNSGIWPFWPWLNIKPHFLTWACKHLMDSWLMSSYQLLTIQVIVATLLFSHINGHIIHIFPTFSLSFLIIFLLLISHLTITIPPTFPQLLSFYLSTTLYLNLTIPSPPSFSYLPFILSLLLLISFTIKIWHSLFHSIHILPTQKGEYSLSLSLSLSLSIYIYIFFLLVDF